LKVGPDRRVIGWLFHGADVVSDTAVGGFCRQGFGRQQGVDAQSAFRVVGKSFGAVVRPAENAVFVRVDLTEGVFQSPVDEGGPPFTFFGQETGFAVA